jgi:small subunit ribosomal protein S17
MSEDEQTSAEADEAGATEPVDEATPPAADEVTPEEEPVAEPEAAAEEAPADEAHEASAEEAPADEPEATAEEAPAEETPKAAPKPKAAAKPKAARKPRAKKAETPKKKPARAKRASGERKPIVRLPKPEHARGRRKERRGVVVSNASDKTIVVRVDTVKPHPRYKKVVRRSQRLHAHDEGNVAKPGDVVRLVETRPVSALKRWRLAEVLEVAK